MVLPGIKPALSGSISQGDSEHKPPHAESVRRHLRDPKADTARRNIRARPNMSNMNRTGVRGKITSRKHRPIRIIAKPVPTRSRQSDLPLVALVAELLRIARERGYISKESKSDD